MKYKELACIIFGGKRRCQVMVTDVEAHIFNFQSSVTECAFPSAGLLGFRNDIVAFEFE